MPEQYLWHTALATLGLEARARVAVDDPGVTLCERPSRAQLAIRGDASNRRFESAIAEVLGVELPNVPKTVNRKAQQALLWLGPNEWLAVLPLGHEAAVMSALEESLDGVYHAVVDVGHSRVVIGLQGSHARDVLMKGTNVDLHPREFGPDNCIHAHLARCHMLLQQLDDKPSYDVYVHRSFAVYAWTWLQDASREYGLAVKSGYGI